MITENKIAEIFCIIRQFGIRVHLKYLQQSRLLHMYRQCLRLVLKEAVCCKGRTQVHDKVMYRAVSRVNKVGLVLEQFVNALDDVPFPQHDLVPHRHQFVLHFNLEPMNKLDTLTEQALEEFLPDVSSVGEDLPIQDLCKHRPYPAINTP